MKHDSAEPLIEAKSASRSYVRCLIESAQDGVKQIAEELTSFQHTRPYYVEALGHVMVALAHLDLAAHAMRPRREQDSRPVGVEEDA